MNRMSILVWFALSSCIVGETVQAVHERVEMDRNGHLAHAHVREKICEGDDQTCKDRVIIERETIITRHDVAGEGMIHGGASIAGENLKSRAQGAYDSAQMHTHMAGENMKHKAQGAYESAQMHTHMAGENMKYKAQGAFDSAANAGENLKFKAQKAYDSAAEEAAHAGENLKYKTHEAFDSAAEGATQARQRVLDAAHHIKEGVKEHLPHMHMHGDMAGAADSMSERAGHMGHAIKEKLLAPISFMYPIFPGFRSWLAILGAIGAQLALSWAWYQLMFKRPFREALVEDRAYKFGHVETFKAMPGVSDKLANAAHLMKDKMAGSATAQKISNSAAAQKISQAGDTMREKIAAGKDQIAAKDSKTKWVSSTGPTAPPATPVITQQVFSSQTPQVTTTTIPLSAATAPITAPPATVTTFSSTTTVVREETNDPAQAAFLREKQKPALTYEGATGVAWKAEPYPVIWGPISSVLVSTIRAFLMFHWLRVLGIHSLSGALGMALFFFFGSQFCSMHHYVWEGRPLKLLLIDHGVELALAATTAFIVYEFGIAH